MALPTDVDADYPDDPARPGRKLHQQHHDALHAFYNLWEGIDPEDIGGGEHTHPESEVTNLVADLAAKETPAGAQAKVDIHTADTTSVHGITDTADLVLDGDARLSDDRTPTAHVIDGAKHTASGLTSGHVMRATGATTFAFGALQDGDIPATIARDSELPDLTGHAAAADPHAGYRLESVAITAADVAADVATQAELDAHINDTTDAHDATAISFAPAGTIAATTVQAAIEEVAAEAGGGVTDGDKGDVTVSGSGATWTVDANAITLAKLADIATARILGRTTAGNGDPEELTAAQVKTLLAIVAGDVSDFDAQVATTAILKSLVDAAGDLLVGTADNTVGRLAKGTALQGLRVNAAETALEWAAPWELVVNEVGTSLAPWTSVSGTWASDGAVISQTAIASSYQALRWTPPLRSLGWILETEILFPSAGQATTSIIYAGFTSVWDATAAGVPFALGSRLQRPFGGTAGKADFLVGNAAAAGTLATVNLDQWYKLRAVVIGGSIARQWLDNVEIDGALLNPANRVGSHVGLFTFNASAQFRNIKAWRFNDQLPG